MRLTRTTLNISFAYTTTDGDRANLSFYLIADLCLTGQSSCRYDRPDSSKVCGARRAVWLFDLAASPDRCSYDSL